ncbi:hypothetical protein ACKI1K_18460 [Streptomyces scabiei]|uniref:hypothetical protein n=1 Tax=Streptomyces scabiei TaxID=1930 RepID=UPI0038F739BE
MFDTLDDVAAIVASRPTVQPLPVDLTLARIVPAKGVAAFDTILAAIDERDEGYDVDWFSEPYEADPQPFDPACECGVCELAARADGEFVVLSNEVVVGPWPTCDPWPADRLVLVVSAN